MNNNVWSNTVPVEKSSYLKTDGVSFFNTDNFNVKNSDFTMLDLFCGAGGFSVGCELAGFKSVMGIDHLEPAMETWVRNHPDAIGCLGDITKIDAESIKELLLEKGIKKIDLITGGVPCQGFSRANRKHNDNDERNFLFREYMRFVKSFLPPYIILENVSGMRSTAGGHFEQAIKKEMETLGYDVTIKLVNAADYGVPQIRQRLIFVGVLQDSGLPKYSFPEGEFAGSYRTVSDAISDLPKLKNNDIKTKYSSEPKTDYQRLMRGVGQLKIKEPSELHNHEAPNHPEETIEKIKNTKQGEPMYPGMATLFLTVL